MELLIRQLGFSLSSGDVTFALDGNAVPALDGALCTLVVTGDIPVPAIERGDRLLLPVGEGIAIDADGEYISSDLDCHRIRGRLCGREGSMSMIIVRRGNKYLLITPAHGENVAYSAIKEDGLFVLRMHTDTKTRVTYGIFDRLVDACQCYRTLRGLKPVTLAEKLRENPEVGALIGGAIVWVWGDNYKEVMYSPQNVDVSPTVGEAVLSVAERLHRGGVDRALFGIFFDEDAVHLSTLYEKYGYIATQYDNYDDCLDPAMLELVPNNRVRNCDYTRRRMVDHPDGLLRDQEGKTVPAWALRGFDGVMRPLNKVCPRIAAQRIREEIPRILEKYPAYRGRFLDVFGGGVRDCYHPDHLITKSECVDVKREAFSFMRRDLSLVTGTEDGFDGILDGLVYSEGMHSPSYFRAKDAGRHYVDRYDDARTAHTAQQMLSPRCRVPLWQLTYHDCLFSFPYWGDSTASSHQLLRQRVLFSCLYGCPPLYSFSAKDFDEVEADILESYHAIRAVNEKVALLPMTDYAVLSEDYMLQRTVFGDEVEVVVNFSEESRIFDGVTVGARDVLCRVLQKK